VSRLRRSRRGLRAEVGYRCGASGNLRAWKAGKPHTGNIYRKPGARNRAWAFNRVRVLIRFDGYRGRYVFHCHNLEHEDMMLGNFEVV
jgi:FtsP/CotA-like multicopper oxidase with cupredoxin domain